VFGGRLGMGVGMGGMRSGGHGKVDQISHGRLEAPLPLEEENPFIDTRLPMGLASPGAVTSHRPALDHSDSDDIMTSPLQFRAPQSQLPSSLLTPPSTTKTTRICTPPRAQQEAAERQRRKEEMKRMMDVECNPFLSHPGEHIYPGRSGPLVDESRSTVAYVFRGAKKVFANPFLRPNQSFPVADLDPEDPDFEPHPCPPPKLLWPNGHSSSLTGEKSPSTTPLTTPRTTGRISRRDEEGDVEMDMEVSGPKHAFTDEEAFVSESDEEEEDALPARRGLLFAPRVRMKRALEGSEEGRVKKAKPGRV